MASALFWVAVFLAVIVATLFLRAEVRDDIRVRAWYASAVKGRMDLLKKIVIYGTLILWAGIWFVSRGEEKASVKSLMKEMSNSWKKPESKTPINSAPKNQIPSVPKKE